MSRLGLRLRSVVTGAIAPLGHELVELGPVLGKAQPLHAVLSTNRPPPSVRSSNKKGACRV
jgi:hypothetical protein